MKRTSIFLGLIGLGLSLGAVGMNPTPVFETKAEATRTEYVDLGPGIWNPNPNQGTPEDRFVPSNYSIAYRNGALMLFPNKLIYTDTSFNKTLPDSAMVDTNLDMVRIYTDTNHYYTLGEASNVSMGSNRFQTNIFADACYNVSFFLNKSLIRSANIHHITFFEGFVLPYPDETHDVKYVIKETMSFANQAYGDEDVEDIVYSFQWDKSTNTLPPDDRGEEEEEEKDIALLPVAACTRADEGYRIHIRGVVYTYDEEALKVDDGTCRLTIFFGLGDYNPEIDGQFNIGVNSSKFDLSDGENSYLRCLYDNILLSKTEGGGYMTLREVADPFTKGLPIYNSWGERYCISFDIGNAKCPEEPSYCATDFNGITIKRGTQFPAFAYTNTFSDEEVRYEQLDDISLTFGEWRLAMWSTHASYAFNAADIDITDVGVRNVAFNGKQSVAIDIGLSESNYAGQENAKILTLNQQLTKYIYVNGRAIYYAYPKDEVEAYANLQGKEETISILIPLDEASKVNEIVIQKGAMVPSLVASAISVDIYRGYVSYYVSNSCSYTRNGDSFKKDERIVWTLWFEDAEPRRVNNGVNFDMDETPVPESTDKKVFLYWSDEEGNEVAGYVKITAGHEYFPVYEYRYTVQFKNIPDEFSIIVNKGVRLTSLEEVSKKLTPSKPGYFFKGWVDEDGNHINVDNKVTKDMVLVATWVESSKASPATNSSNNGLAAALIIIGVAAVAVLVVDVVLLIAKRKD